MKTFTDAAGRTWTISLNLGTAMAVKGKLDVDLLQPEAGDPPLLTRLGTDEMLLGEVLCALLEGQFETHKVTADDVRAAFDGQTLLLTRRVPGGVAIVAWSLRTGHWQRWIGPALAQVGALQDAWLRAQGLRGNESGQLTVADNASGWQLYKYINGSRTNFQSTGNVALPAAGAASGAAPREMLPDAVEMVLTLDGNALTRVVTLPPAGGAS